MSFSSHSNNMRALFFSPFQWSLTFCMCSSWTKIVCIFGCLLKQFHMLLSNEKEVAQIQGEFLICFHQCIIVFLVLTFVWYSVLAMPLCCLGYWLTMNVEYVAMYFVCPFVWWDGYNMIIIDGEKLEQV